MRLSGGVKPVTTGTHVLTFDSLSKDLVAAGVVSRPRCTRRTSSATALRPGTGDDRLTDVNGDVLAGQADREDRGDHLHVDRQHEGEGWIVKPPVFDASKKYPLILEIHGGPFSMYNVAFNYMFQNFAANGFVVLVHEPARQHRLRQRVHQRHRSQLPGT